MTTIIVIVVILLLLIVWVVSMYNRLVSLRNNRENAFADLRANERRRACSFCRVPPKDKPSEH